MKEFLNSILDIHPDLICRYSADWKLQYINKSCADFFGNLAENCIGHPFSDFVPAAHASEAEAMISEISIEKPQITSLQKFDREDDQFCWISWTNIGIFHPDGSIKAYQSIGRDVTQEIILNKMTRMRQKEISNVRAELRSVLDAIPAMIWYKDDKNKILHLNESAASSMGLSVAEVEGHNTYDLFGTEAKKYHEDDLKVINSGVPYTGIIERFTPNDGDPRWVQTDKIPFNVSTPGDRDDEGTKRILVVATDITELKEKEALLSSINKNLDDFTALTSHDLQAPLRKIGLSAELLNMELNGSVSPAAHTNLTDITNGVTHMQTLIGSFLKLMRSTPGGVELETINLREVLEDTQTRLMEEFYNVRGQLIIPQKDMFIKGDAALMTQVFNNLIENSIKYRSSERELRIEVSAWAHERTWTLRVQDNGVGIDSSELKQIFELFGRAKPHMSVHGYGVGLALCKRIVGLHGGSLTYVANKHEGTCFEMTFNQSGRLVNG